MQKKYDIILKHIYNLIFFFLPISVSITCLLEIVAFIIFMVFKRDKGLNFVNINKSICISVLVFMFLPMIGLLWSNAPQSGLIIVTKSYYWLHSFVIASLIITYNFDILRSLNFFLVGLTLVSITSVLQIIHILPESFILPTFIAKYNGKHIIGSLFLTFGMIILSNYFAEIKDFRKKLVILFIVLLYFLTLILSQGRIGYLTFIILFPVIIRNFLKNIKGYQIILTLFAILVIMYFSPPIRERIRDIIFDIDQFIQSNPNTSMGLRFVMWLGAVDLFLKHPLIGVGTGGYKIYMIEYIHSNFNSININLTDPHNAYLHMATNFGILGIFSIFFLFIAYFYYSWLHRSRKSIFIIFLYGIILLISNTTATQILSPYTGKMFAIFTGYLMGSARFSKNENYDSNNKEKTHQKI